MNCRWERKYMINGVINIYKEKGYTSHDVVAKLRRIVGQKKIGHTGTLDPDATGVLPVCIGKATKVVDLLTEKDKTYIAGVKLGVKTDTLDMTGTVLETRPVTCTGEELEQCLKSFEGDIEQVPPMYSAIKIQGKRLYEMARQGKTVERKPRKVTIYSLKLLQADLEKNWFEIEVHCSKGTYIRSLCDDIGEKLGCLAAMDSLVRTQVGRFSLDEAYTLDEIEQKVKEDRLDEVLLSIDSLFMEYPAVQVLETGMKYLQNGNEIPVNSCQDGDKIAFRKTVRMYDTNREFYALYQRNAATNKFSIVKMFHP